jgi:hypothetical protein
LAAESVEKPRVVRAKEEEAGSKEDEEEQRDRAMRGTQRLSMNILCGCVRRVLLKPRRRKTIFNTAQNE